jgi:AbrB family looped-hinge helix DNA binding protein
LKARPARKRRPGFFLAAGHVWRRRVDWRILTKSLSMRRGYEMAATATLSSKFQISIPKAVREEQNWQPGQEFVFIPKGKGVLVMPVPELEQLAGIAKGARKDGYRDRKDRY